MTPIKSYRIEIGEVRKFTVYLVGTGGTGSFVAFHLARLAWAAKEKNFDLRLIFIDPDTVELKNVGRQAFAPAELGQPKAVALARRYSYAFGLQIESRVTRFQAGMVDGNFGGLALVIGCVDNAAARREMAKVTYHKRIWWLDAGNDKFSGQVMIGNAAKMEIDPTGFAVAVPRPDAQWPELLADTATPDPVAPDAPALSCAQLLAMEAQSLMINQAMAGIVGTYAFRLIMARDLEVMKTYINLESLSMQSEAITGEVGKIEVEKKPPLREGAPAGLVYALDWDEGELLEIADGACPECGAVLVEGRDTVDEEEADIVFCPNCHWIMAVDDLRAWIANAAEEMEPAR